MTAQSARARVEDAWAEARPLRLELVCFPLVAAVYLAYLFLAGYDRFYYDATQYWQLGEQFENNGHFSLVSYHFPWRGYSLPLLNHVLQVVASAAGLGGVTIVKLFGALLAATLGVIVLPRLARQLFPAASIGFTSVLALNALIFLYWRDHFDFPLSDLSSLLVAALGVVGLLRGTNVGYVGAGIGLGLAANVRPAYLPALLLAVAVAALLPLRAWDRRARGVAAALVLGGAILVSLPQIAINHHQYGSWSPLITKGRDITLIQLWQGMRAQKYETYVGPRSGYPQAGVFYLDPATRHVAEREEIAPVLRSGGYPEFPSYGRYLRMVLEHPAEMAGAYVRRAFNGLDVKYPTPYIRDLGDTSLVLSLVQYTLVFAAAARLVLPDARRALGRIGWAGIAVLLAACLGAVPGAIEPRFFLPLHLLVYMLVCFAPAPRAVLGGSLGRRVAVAGSYVGFVLICLTLSSAALAQLQHPGEILGLAAATP